MRRSYGINWHINTVTGIYDFIKECKAVAIKPVGIEFRYNNKLLYIGLAKNAAGLAEMNRFNPT
jgi:DNA polymerase-3 subunit alpha/error-prone DNA polymerase